MFKKINIKEIRESLALLVIAAIVGTIVSFVAQLFIISAKNIYDFLFNNENLIVTFDILYGEGISREGEIIDLGVAHKILDKSGAWYSYGETRLGQGKDKVRDFLKTNPDMMQEIQSALFEKVLPKHAEDDKANT